MINAELVEEEVGSFDRARIAIALVSASVLVYEIAITRINSALLWYHFAFLSITLALLGLGAPGLWCYVFPPKPGFAKKALLATALLIPSSLLLIMYTAKIGTTLELGIYILAMLLPLTAAGAAVFRLLDLAQGKMIARMYGADLLGAATGALLVVPLMRLIPTPALIAGSAILPLAALLIVSRRPSIAALPALLLIAGTITFGEPEGWLPIGKQQRKPGEPPPDVGVVIRKWTPTALITIFETRGNPFFWGRGSAYPRGPAPGELLGVELDGSAGTPVARADRPLDELTYLFYDVTSTAYQLQPARRVCIIGAGGGRDILTALKGGATEVDAVELNGGLIELLSGPLAARTGDVYHLRGVNAVASEGRSFLSRSRGDYDVIQLSLIDSWAATAAGAFSLSENNLYTVEAFQMYWRRLSPKGIISTSRWYSGKQQMETVRLIAIAVEALSLEGVREPHKHLALLSAGSVATLLISRVELDAAAIDRLDELARLRGFDRAWPLREGESAASLAAASLIEGTGKIEAWGFDVRPSTDERPFFFQTVPLFGGIDEEARRSLSTNEQSVLILRSLMIAMSLLAMVMFLVPIGLARKKLERGADFWRGTIYFFSVGLAFMFVEVPAIQRFILYLGHPSHATTVVLATLLVGAGVGSMLVGRFDSASTRRFGVLVPLVIGLWTLMLEPLFTISFELAFFARVAIAAIVLVPLGVLLGMAFPAGMIAFGDRNKAWFWAINGVASVLASVCSIGFSIAMGFSSVLMLGVLFYLLAWAMLKTATNMS